MARTIAAPEGIRGQVQNLPRENGSATVEEFTQQDYDKFMRGYRSQYEEISMWVNAQDIEGTAYSQASYHKG